MEVRILPAARERLIGIWQYTAEVWGEEQADAYIEGLVSEFNRLMSKRDLWRPVKDRRFKGIFYSNYRHHYLFFKTLGDGALGVITILHENMDLPSRLKDDLQE